MIKDLGKVCVYLILFLSKLLAGSNFQKKKKNEGPVWIIAQLNHAKNFAFQFFLHSFGLDPKNWHPFRCNTSQSLGSLAKKKKRQQSNQQPCQEFWYDQILPLPKKMAWLRLA